LHSHIGMSCMRERGGRSHEIAVRSPRALDAICMWGPPIKQRQPAAGQRQRRDEHVNTAHRQPALLAGVQRRGLRQEPERAIPRMGRREPADRSGHPDLSERCPGAAGELRRLPEARGQPFSPDTSAERELFASPNNIRVLGLKNSGFSTPAKPGRMERFRTMHVRASSTLMIGMP
jgi:hypothetical protein